MKEDDMDEMMRKAAENYDIDAGKAADWNAVYNAVHATEQPLPPVAEKKRRRRFAFWWLLLIPLGWIASNEYNKFKDGQHNETVKSPSQVKEELNNNQQPAAADKAQVKTAPANNSMDDVIINSNENKNSRSNKIVITQSGRLPATNNIAAFHPLPVKEEPAINQSSANQFKENQAGLPTENNSIVNNNTNAVDLNKDEEQVITQNHLPALSKAKTETDTTQLNTGNTSKKIIKNPKGDNHYFYAGLAAGTDLSFIKYQSARPLGYNVGLLAGYKFNKLSIESGFFIDRKNYYTKGKYFDKSGIAYFRNSEILTVDGYCTMFEIPLNIKYNFIEKKNHAWFATAGVSSYLMNKEFYNYDYLRDGEEHYGSRAYYHAAQNWLSVLNLSAGYELKTGKKTSFRIEPYYKTSLNGLGTGKLSISSAGINASLVRRIP
ncbi:porin family protein [Parafilimonas terrae]|nr:hypothetical protein [Parafilimonas terrae]